jgi:hypothetical protein
MPCSLLALVLARATKLEETSMTNALTIVLRAAVDACRPDPTDPNLWQMTGAASALAAAKKAKATAGDPGVAWLAKRLTPKSAMYSDRVHGGPDLMLQECLRAPVDTGLPAAAEALLDAWPRFVMAPVFRMPTEWDKAKLKAERMPQDFAVDASLSADGSLALVSGGRGVARYRLSDGALDAFWSSGQSTAFEASLSREGTLAAVVKKRREGKLVRVREADAKPEVTPLGDVVRHALRRDGGALAVVCDRTFEGGISVRNEPLPPGEVFELSVWALPEAAKPRRVLRRLMPEGVGADPPALSFDAQGRLYVDGPDGLERLSGDAWGADACWTLPGAVSSIEHAPSGARLLVTVRDAAHESKHLLVDAATGRVEATWLAAGSFLDEALVVCGSGYRASVVRGATGEPVAKATFTRYVRAVAAPGDRVVVIPAPGNDPGPVEVFEVRRPKA